MPLPQSTLQLHRRFAGGIPAAANPGTFEQKFISLVGAVICFLVGWQSKSRMDCLVSELFKMLCVMI